MRRPAPQVHRSTAVREYPFALVPQERQRVQSAARSTPIAACAAGVIQLPATAKPSPFRHRTCRALRQLPAIWVLRVPGSESDRGLVARHGYVADRLGRQLHRLGAPAVD